MEHKVPAHVGQSVGAAAEAGCRGDRHMHIHRILAPDCIAIAGRRPVAAQRQLDPPAYGCPAVRLEMWPTVTQEEPASTAACTIGTHGQACTHLIQECLMTLNVTQSSAGHGVSDHTFILYGTQGLLSPSRGRRTSASGAHLAVEFHAYAPAERPSSLCDSSTSS